jgi:ATP-binding cassette subfamily B protein
MFLNSGLTSAMLVATGFTTLLVVGYGGMQVIEGVISLGTFTAFIFYLNMMLAPIREGGIMVTLFQRGGSAAARIFDILDHEPEIRDAPEAAPLNEVGGVVTLNHLSYAHPASSGDEGWPSLNDVTLDIKKGEMIALLGRVGSGKSTLLRLIVRLLDPPPGTVYLDGRDIRLLPQGYDTVLTERGRNLSHGQRQLLAFARVLAMDPEVLILDEATASIDTETELIIQDALAKVTEGRTSIIIAHRLQTIREANRIVVLTSAEVREIGTHEELIAQGGLYKTLYELQVQDLGAGDAAS